MLRINGIKMAIAIILMVVTSLFGCAHPGGGPNTEKGALIGAGVGALAGQVIGEDTEATLLGAGIGTLMGAMVGNSYDHKATATAQMPHAGSARTVPQSGMMASPQAMPPAESPPGRWVMVPGRWQSGRWVPEHRVWQPVDPY